MRVHLLGNISSICASLPQFLLNNAWSTGSLASVTLSDVDLIIAGHTPAARDAAAKSGKPWVWLMSPDWLGNITGASLLLYRDISTVNPGDINGIPAILLGGADAEQHLQSVTYPEKSRIVFIASEDHYLKHVTPTMCQTHPQALGVTLVPASLTRLALQEGHQVLGWREGADEIRYALARRVDPSQSLAVVVGLADQVTAEKLGFSVVRGEHGIGQTYETSSNRSSSYAGSPMHSRLYAYLAPGSHPHQQHVDRCPGVASFRVGSPFLDRFPPRENMQDSDAVGFVFHWNNQAQPETCSTWAYWVDPILDLIHKGIPVRLHCHPREAANFRSKFLTPHNLDGLWVETMEELHQVTDVVCGDNTSAIYFMAAAGHPVVLLNHPTYRREVEHGLRFWECSDVGIPCDKKWDLEASVTCAAARDEEDLRFKEDALRYVFFRRAGASVVEALLLESLLRFKQTQLHGSKRSVKALTTFDAGDRGRFVKGETYQLRIKDTEEMLAKGLVVRCSESAVYKFPWPRETGNMSEARQPNEKLYQVIEKFNDHGVDYKPGDFVRKKEILATNLTEKCKVYESKTRRPHGMETKTK